MKLDQHNHFVISILRAYRGIRKNCILVGVQFLHKDPDFLSLLFLLFIPANIFESVVISPVLQVPKKK